MQNKSINTEPNWIEEGFFFLEEYDKLSAVLTSRLNPARTVGTTTTVLPLSTFR